jgi:hypothetical protein
MRIDRRWLPIVALVSPPFLQCQPLVTGGKSLDRYGPDDLPPPNSTAAIYAARNEYESFQIIVRAPASGLTNVNVIAPDLTGPGRSLIPRARITLYREHYVHIRRAAGFGHRNTPQGQGIYPDALIPFNDPVMGSPLTKSGAKFTAVPFKVDSDRNQVIWVDVFVPDTAAPGVYKGDFLVTSDQGQADLALSLTVWNFSLPKKPALMSSFNYWRASASGTAMASEDTRRTAIELLRNRLMPATVYPPDERFLIDNYGLVNTALPLWSGAYAGNCAMSPPPSVAAVKALRAQHQPDVFVSVNSADEIGACTGVYPAIRSWATNLHQAGVPNLVVMPPAAELMKNAERNSAVDIWVVLPKQYGINASLIRQALLKGDRVWSYNALMQDAYSPKWQIDFAPVNYRIQPGFISQSLGLTGLLYWRIDQWTNDPWNDVETVVVGGYPYPGEGMLVYPGAQAGIIGCLPSMRLKYLRDGVDDYDYVEILKRLGRGEWALRLARTVGPDWVNWSSDAARLESVRIRLAQEIDRINTAGASLPARPTASPK